MSRMKDLYTEIHDLYKEGMKPVHIATKLNIPLYMVSGALAMQASPKEMKYFDGQPVMNERIKELAIQAGYEKDSFGIGHWDMPEFKKFAELIIGECINKIETHQIPVGNSAAGEMACEWTYAALKEIRDEIKQHFGAEE